MQYSFRLAELLGHVPDPRKRPGTIKAIVEYTGLDRHQVAALLKNEVKYIPLKALSRLCDFLIEHGHASADQLPGALFSVEPENFWELLARRRRLEMCVGVRKDNNEDSPEVSFVVASDSVLLGELLNGVTTLGGTAKLRKTDASSNPLMGDALPHPEHLKQSLVWSPGQATDAEVLRRSKTVYNDFSESKGDKALVGIGSTKSNPVVEIVLSKSFNCDPFVSQDDVENASDRAIPFFMRYRGHDPHSPSCVERRSRVCILHAPRIPRTPRNGPRWFLRSCNTLARPSPRHSRRGFLASGLPNAGYASRWLHGEVHFAFSQERS